MKRKKIWVASPVFYVLAALLFVMAGVNWFQGNDVLFYVELARSRAGRGGPSPSRRSGSGSTSLPLSRAPVPCWVWRNTKISRISPCRWPSSVRRATFFGERRVSHLRQPGTRAARGKCVETHLPEKYAAAPGSWRLRSLLEDRQFTVFAAKTEHGFVLYFIDDTYYKEINREFEETRPIVALAYFDNREELARDSSGMEDAASPLRWSLLSTSGRTPWAASASAFPAAVSHPHG